MTTTVKPVWSRYKNQLNMSLSILIQRPHFSIITVINVLLYKQVSLCYVECGVAVYVAGVYNNYLYFYTQGSCGDDVCCVLCCPFCILVQSAKVSIYNNYITYLYNQRNVIHCGCELYCCFEWWYFVFRLIVIKRCNTIIINNYSCKLWSGR